MRQTSRRFARDERGAIVVMLGLTITSLLMIAGLAVDVGWWYTLQRQNQSAADAAAVSAAYEYAYSNLTWTPAQLTPSAAKTATQNRYAGNAPEVTLPGAGKVQVVLRQDQGTWFSSLANLAGNKVTIATGAVAQVTALAPGCVIALSQNAQHGISLQGKAAINAPDCTLISDSSSDQSIFLNDNANNITAATVVTAGEVSPPKFINDKTFKLAFPQQTGAAVVPDPYANTLTHAALVPSAAIINTACTYTAATKTWSGNCTVIPNSDARCNPGKGKQPPPNCFDIKNDKLSGNTRIDGDWSPSSNITLPAGTYWITDGHLEVKNVIITCAGCTIIMTTVAIANPKIGYVTTSAGGILNLTAPNAGTFAGMVLIQDTVVGEMELFKQGQDNFGLYLNANAAPNLSGLVYFPNTDVGFQGTPLANGVTCRVLIAKTVQLNGNSGFATSGCAALGLDPNQLSVKTVALVQ